jgi:hypothetical protein
LAHADLDPGEVNVSTPVYEPGQGQFPQDERWTLAFNWSGIPVGGFSVELRRTGTDEAPMLDISVHGGTNSAVDLLWKYRLDATGTVRTDPFRPVSFDAKEQENRKQKVTRIRFAENGSVNALRQKGDRKREFEFVAPNMFDILSSIFLILNLDYQVGDEYYVDVLTGASRYLVTVDVEARERLEYNGSSTEAFRLSLESRELTEPDEGHSRQAKHQESRIWVSAERPRRMLKAKSATFVGSISGWLAAVEPLATEPEAAGVASPD